ncbi:MAG: DUF5330 domain-containing protein [Bacteroidota bacterium]|jgi:hypothetical protein
MFLIRLAFWLSLLVLVLPTDPRQQEKLFTATSETVHRIATFCERNSTMCERGGEYWTLFKQKLEFGARLAFEIASEHLMTGKAEAPEATGSISPTAAARPDRARGAASPAEPVPDTRVKAGKGGA